MRKENIIVQNEDEMLGRVVVSTAGRDFGRSFIVIAVIDNDYVLVADGDLRRIEKPKKKKRKHLRVTDRMLEALKLKFVQGLKVSNMELRKALSALVQENDSTEDEAHS